MLEAPYSFARKVEFNSLRMEMKLDFVILKAPLEKLLFFMTPLEQQLVWH
jgi:hypothetical protein